MELILIHGALGAKQDLEKLAVALRKENYTVHLFSFSGHGRSEFKAAFNIQQFAVELETFILENKLQQPSVIGYSMGGYVALCLALKDTSLINKIITLGTKFNWAKEVVEKETRLLVPGLMLQKVPAFANALETKHGSSWQELVVKTAALMEDIGLANYLNPENLKAINNKILLGLGDKDQMVTLEETISVYKNLPNANLYVMPDTKHPVEHLNVELFVAIADAFLKG